MARKPKQSTSDKSLRAVTDYRYQNKRKNNPPAKIAAEGFVPLIPKAAYFFSPRRPPELRFDPTGAADQLPDLLAKATKEPLTNDEANVLAAALRINEPWLEWAGKREQKSFTVDPLALHIHERVSTQAILKSPPAKTSTAVSSPIPSRNTTRPSSSTGTMSANAPKATRGPAT